MRPIRAHSEARSHQISQGFTLLELLVVIMVSLILVGIGTPTFTYLIQSNRAITQSTRWQSTIQYARSEAMKRGKDIYIVSASNSNNWSDGWYVHADDNGNGLYDASEELKVFQALPSTSVFSASISMVSFNRKGFVNALRTSDSYQWTLTQTVCSGDINREMTLYQSGQLRVSSTTCP